ncbi:hypothetical protein B0H13DRAFT_2045546 [Mycena leptocephala]|nr:hypothetical protein B0H13DRAFT_2045546 [Mycena leptocephala]
MYPRSIYEESGALFIPTMHFLPSILSLILVAMAVVQATPIPASGLTKRGTWPKFPRLNQLSNRVVFIDCKPCPAGKLCTEARESWNVLMFA